MSAVAKQPAFFSAYPLKVLEKAAAQSIESSRSPYLKALLSNNARPATRLRVSPMVNPYKEPLPQVPSKRPSAPAESRVNDSRDWYSHYE